MAKFFQIMLESAQTHHWGVFSKVNTIQYLVWPPADWITVWQGPLIERKYRRIMFIGMLFHFCPNTCWSWRNICGWTGCWHTSVRQVSYLFYQRQVWRFGWPFHNIHVIYLQILRCQLCRVWAGIVLLENDVKWNNHQCQNWALRFPLMTTRFIFVSWRMPPCTISDPTWNLSASLMQASV